MNRKSILVAGLTGLFAFGFGLTAAGSHTAPPAPQPTPRIIVTQGPQPTPRIVEQQVEVAPAECATAIKALVEDDLATTQIVSDILDAYLNFPDENLGEFGKRVETILNDSPAPNDIKPALDAADICLAAIK